MKNKMRWKRVLLQELGEGGGPGTNNEMRPVIICGFNVGKIGSLELMED